MNTILFSHDKIGDAAIKIRVYLNVLGIWPAHNSLWDNPLDVAPLVCCRQNAGNMSVTKLSSNAEKESPWHNPLAFLK
jgi:hypothetical protein